MVKFRKPESGSGMIFAFLNLHNSFADNYKDAMKNIVFVLLSFVVISCAVAGQEGRRAERKSREEATAAEITRMVEERSHPIYGTDRPSHGGKFHSSDFGIHAGYFR